MLGLGFFRKGLGQIKTNNTSLCTHNPLLRQVPAPNASLPSAINWHKLLPPHFSDSMLNKPFSIPNNKLLPSIDDSYLIRRTSKMTDGMIQGLR